jgi:8-oxo-dGTP pyrophosphatase MutT (NUDIX family)
MEALEAQETPGSLQIPTTDEVCLIEGELREPQFRFRTIDGLRVATNMSIEETAIRAVLEETGIARQPGFTTRDGRQLYAPSDQPITLGERLGAVGLMNTH